jgi:hypothetical protein
MKVENPRFPLNGEVLCQECPFENMGNDCLEWMAAHRGKKPSHPGKCPTKKTYAEAVTLADKAIAAKEGRE